MKKKAYKDKKGMYNFKWKNWKRLELQQLCILYLISSAFEYFYNTANKNSLLPKHLTLSIVYIWLTQIIFLTNGFSSQIKFKRYCKHICMHFNSFINARVPNESVLTFLKTLKKIIFCYHFMKKICYHHMKV